MSDNYEQIPGQTMFQFLKRKKKFLLQQSLSQSKIDNQQITKRQSVNRSTTPKQLDEEQTRRYKRQQKSIITEKSSFQKVTPKRVSFIEEERRPATRSFMQMISPLRNKSPLTKQNLLSSKGQPQSKKISYKQNYTRRLLNDKINTIRDTIQGFLKTGRTLKQKSHSLFIQMKPILHHVEQCEDSCINLRKLEEIRNKLRTFENGFKQFDIQHSSSAIEDFYRIIAEHLNELEGHTRLEIEEIRTKIQLQVRQANNNSKDGHAEQKRKLERQIDALTKKYEKLEKNYQRLISKNEENLEKQSVINKQNIEEIQKKYLQQKNKLQGITEEYEAMSKKFIQLQKELKNIRFLYQKKQNDHVEQSIQIKSQKQEYLLNEILILKSEFNSDIQQLAQLHRQKEADLMERNSFLQAERVKNQKVIENLINKQIQNGESINLLKTTTNRFKKQNECLATDMHRINQELYQHWLALKDIKTLSLRLDIFPKFKRIFDDLAYNQQLFT